MSAEQGDETGIWNLAAGKRLSEEEQAWMDRALGVARRLGVVAAFAVGLGLILIGIGNGIWRLTSLAEFGSGQGLLRFLFHLATASTLVVLGASLLPVALHLVSADEEISLAQPAVLFASLWLIVGAFQLFTGGFDGGEVTGGALVLMLAGTFGLISLMLYDSRRTGPALSAGVLGLVASGLLIGGVATVPGSITNASRFGSELIFRYGEAVHVSGYLVGILAATVYPFVRGSPGGPAGVLLGASVGGLIWGLGEIVFAAWWLVSVPWAVFGSLGAGASVGYAFVLAGGLATVVGGLATLGVAAALAGHAATPLASSLPNATTAGPGQDGAPEVAGREEPAETSGDSMWACSSCGTKVRATEQTCPACGHEPEGHSQGQSEDPAHARCQACSQRLSAQAAYCPACGAATAEG